MKIHVAELAVLAGHFVSKNLVRGSSSTRVLVAQCFMHATGTHRFNSPAYLFTFFLNLLSSKLYRVLRRVFYAETSRQN